MSDVMAAVRAAVRATVRGQEGDGNAASPGQVAGPDRRPGPLLAGAAPSLAILLWGVITVVALATRPLLPVDETRYAAVAWEMWLRGDALVPYLNGVPYSHKPPLLFWLVEAGWLVGGRPSMLWARLVGPLCMALDLWLVHRLACRLWPERPEVARLAPLVLLATLLWAVYGTLLLFDALLTACVLVALLGVVELRDGGRRRGAALLVMGVGSGILAKGPVVFIHLLPVLLLAPWWTRGASHPAGRQEEGDWPDGQRPIAGARWALWAGGAVVGGILLALLWAIPAGVAGGPAYQREIFLGQTTGRMVRSFAHRRPVWWYLPQLLWMLLPWWLWPALWRGARRLAGAGRPRDPGVRFCLAWSIPALAAFSLVSGKQVHYLIPELPALALLAARALLAPAPGPEGPEAARGEAATGRRGGGILLPALVLALPGLVLTMLVLVAGRLTLPPGLVLPPLWAALPLALAPPAIALVVGRGGAAGAARRRGTGGASSVRGAMALAAASVALVAGVHLVAMPALAERYDLGPVSRHLGGLERAGVPLAHVGRYSGQFSLAGRIRRPLDVIDARDVGGWLALHPGGAVVRYETARPARTVDFAQRFGEGWWVVERGPGPSGP